MKKIKLTQNKYALVDDIDFGWLNKFKWYAEKGDRNKSYYAYRNRSAKETGSCRAKMHREILKTPKGMETDHIDGDGLNNQRKNLRICSGPENKRNVGLTTKNTSGLKGVSFYKRNKKWRAKICVNNKHFHLGYFESKIEAYEVYCKACIRYHGKFAKIK